MGSSTITKIGKYEVVEILGKGGMGVVYKAMDNLIERLVAIKMMTGGFTENPDLLKRFYREAKSTGMLQHPNIVIVYELGEHEGNPYLVMEFLEGEPLDKIIASRRDVSMVEKLGYIIQCCTGLAYAHQRGIVHRDVKPANLMVLKDGNCKIVDFGIARIGDNSMTRTGQVVGTITYMSPEQINAQVVDGRSDIFSAGVMLYELLTGALPFEGKDTASTLLKIIHEAPPPRKNYIPTYPPELDEVIRKALAKDREERYATAEDFAFDLGRVQEQLKKHLVSDYVARAKASIEKSDLAKAKEILQAVLRVDTQHQIAKELMQEVQQRLQRQVRGEQIRQLRANAEDAFAQKQLDDALSYAEQALTIDKSNADLKKLRDAIQEAKTRRDKLENAFRRAASAQQTGDLEEALKAVEEALAVEADNSQAKSLHAAISKELKEKVRQKELKGFLEEARRDITGRKFTAAFEILKKAEQIDPSSPEVHALMNLAVSGRDQESRRKDLEKFTNEIEDALAHDDYGRACERVDQALARFSNDPGLLKLKVLSEKQREAGQKKKFVEEQMAAARKLLDSGQAAEALATLERAAAKVPGDNRLRSLLAIVRESAEQERTEKIKSDYIQKANEARRKKDFDNAVRILETAATEFDNSSELQGLLQLAREEAVSQVARRKIDAAAEEAQRLIGEEEYERAVAVLENVLKQYPDEELKVVLADAKRQIEEFNKRVEAAVTRAQRLLEMRKVDEAATFLESQAKSMARSSGFTATLEKARALQDQIRGVSGVVEKVKAAVQKGDFASAVTIMEACKKTYGETPEVKQAIAELESKRSAAARTKVDKAVKDARTLLLARQYVAALQTLNEVAALASAAPPDLQKQFETLKKDASAGVARQQKEADLGKTIVAGSAEAGGHTMVAGSYESTGAAVAPAPARAGAAARPAARPAPVPVAPKKSPWPKVIAAVAVLAVAIIGYLMLRPSGPVTESTYVEVNAVPWGMVKSITTRDGKVVKEVNQQTPVRVALAPGEYKVVVAGPKGEQKSETIKVTAGQGGSVYPVFEAIDVEKILNQN